MIIKVLKIQIEAFLNIIFTIYKLIFIGNEFTSLEGIEFSWNLHQKDSIIRFITFRDSPYETPHSITFFDTKGLKGHIALLEGVKTGAAKVIIISNHINVS